jgi:hypothetical protein
MNIQKGRQYQSIPDYRTEKIILKFFESERNIISENFFCVDSNVLHQTQENQKRNECIYIYIYILTRTRPAVSKHQLTRVDDP